jgi:hypothetical protein
VFQPRKSSYTCEQWLDQLPTFGGHNRLPQTKLDELLTAVGGIVDGVGGSFEMAYATVVLTARRRPLAQVIG